VYRPDQSAYLDGLIEGDRDASFQLKNGVILRGGYAGWGTPDPDQRDIKGYATILSGDLARNDPAGIDLEDMVYGAGRRDNSIHVVVGTGTDNTAVLEGFVVTGGNANDSGDDGWVSTDCGGGLYNGSGSCTVRECVFMYNSALYGGAVYNRDGSCPVFVNCTFSYNAYAGMYNDVQSSPILEGCVFEDNLSCGMANCDRSNPTLTDCWIRRNRSGSAHGCGISNMDGSCPVLNRCVFEENFTGQRGGALYCRDNSNAVATGCVFRKNRAT
jgi:predicted outer membrane repeat protein